MRNQILLSLVFCVAGCTAGLQTPYAGSARQCERSFTIQGTALGGRSFTSNIVVTGGSKEKIFDSLASQIALNGWTIVSSDRTTGIVSAQTSVAFSEGNTAPLSGVVAATPNGYMATLTLSTNIGEFASATTAKDQFCKMLEAVQQASRSVSAASPRRRTPSPKAIY